MRTTIKASMTAVLLSSVVLVPAATVVTFATADAVFAKSDKAGGKGGGKSGAAQGKAKGKSGGKSSGKSGGKSASSRGKSGGIGGFFDKLTGKDRKATRTAKASGKPAKGSGMHPSELGNMNGALNANINAVLAHIRNGNTNGPVGGMAALAVANAGAAGAEELIQRDDYFEVIGGQLGDGVTVQDYYDSVFAAREDARDPTLEDAFAALENSDPNDDAAAQAVIGSSAFANEQAYNESLDAAEAAARDSLVDTAIDELGGDSQSFVDIPEGVVDPTDEDRLAADDALNARTDAELAMLDLWNKNPDDSPEISPETEQPLLDKLYERLEGNEDSIADAIGEPDVDEELIEDVVDCEGLEDCADADEMAELTE